MQKAYYNIHMIEFDIDKLGKIEGISEELRAFINTAEMSFNITRNAIVIPGEVANELSSNEQLKGILKECKKIYIDMREQTKSKNINGEIRIYNDDSNRKFNLLDFIESTKGLDYTLTLQADNIFDLSEEMIQELASRPGIKVEMKKTDNDRSVHEYEKENITNKEKMLLYGMDEYTGSEILELREKFKLISDKIPNNITTDEKVKALYEQLKKNVKIEDMQEDKEALLIYQTINVLMLSTMNTGNSRKSIRENSKKIEELTKNKIGVRAEYKSMLDTLNTGKGNAIDFLDTFYMLLKYNGIDCRDMSNLNVLIDKQMGRQSQNYTDEFATPSNAIIPLKVRTIRYIGNDGKAMKVKKFIDELVVEDEKTFNDNAKNKTEKTEETPKIDETKENKGFTLKDIKSAVSNFLTRKSDKER